MAAKRYVPRGTYDGQRFIEIAIVDDPPVEKWCIAALNRFNRTRRERPRCTGIAARGTVQGAWCEVRGARCEVRSAKCDDMAYTVEERLGP